MQKELQVRPLKMMAKNLHRILNNFDNVHINYTQTLQGLSRLLTDQTFQKLSGLHSHNNSELSKNHNQHHSFPKFDWSKSDVFIQDALFELSKKNTQIKEQFLVVLDYIKTTNSTPLMNPFLQNRNTEVYIRTSTSEIFRHHIEITEASWTDHITLVHTDLLRGDTPLPKEFIELVTIASQCSYVTLMLRGITNKHLILMLNKLNFSYQEGKGIHFLN